MNGGVGDGDGFTDTRHGTGVYKAIDITCDGDTYTSDGLTTLAWSLLVGSFTGSGSVRRDRRVGPHLL
jgi:hypothetical protein